MSFHFVPAVPFAAQSIKVPRGHMYRVRVRLEIDRLPHNEKTGTFEVTPVMTLMVLNSMVT